MAVVIDAISTDKFVGVPVGGPVTQKNSKVNIKILVTVIHTFSGIFVGRV